MVATLIELKSNFPDVSRNNYKVSVGEANQDVAITVPRQAEGKEQV